MLATIEVIGATVVTTRNLPPPNGPEADEPAVEAAAGHTNSATKAFSAELSSFAPFALLPHPTKRANTDVIINTVDTERFEPTNTPLSMLIRGTRYCEGL